MTDSPFLAYLSATVFDMATNKHETAETAGMMPAEAARRLFVTPRTLLRMAERGEVRSIRLPSGHRRYNSDDIDRLAAQIKGDAA